MSALLVVLTLTLHFLPRGIDVETESQLEMCLDVFWCVLYI